MSIKLICVGKIKEKFYTEAIEEYSKRLSRYCKLEIIELPDEKCEETLSEAQMLQVLDKEGKRILSKISDADYVTALAIKGKNLDSVEFSSFLGDRMVSGDSNLVFIIGGSLGLSQEVYNRCNYLLSFSKMTFPHQLMRVIFLEQLYRGFRILKNEPYHK